MNKVFCLLVTVLLVTGCGESPNTPGSGKDELQNAPELSGRVRLDGSSTVFPISEAVAEEFGALAPRVRVTVGVSGTGGGFKKFLNKETDINDASRPIKASEAATAAAQGIAFIELPIAYDGLSVVVSHANTFVDHLSVEELNRIWQPESKVITWKDIRAEWPDQAIHLFGPGTDSGTFDYFTEAINGKAQASRADFTASEDDNVLVAGVAGDEFALGYFGFAYYVENQDKLKVVPIDGGSGPIAPSPETINNGTYAPLSRPIFIYVASSSLDDAAVARFVDFYIDNAAKLATEVGYIDLPSDAYAKARERIANRVVGSAYTGETKVESLIAGH